MTAFTLAALLDRAIDERAGQEQPDDAGCNRAVLHQRLGEPAGDQRAH